MHDIGLGTPPNVSQRATAQMDVILTAEEADDLFPVVDGTTGGIRTIVDGAEAEVRFDEPPPLLIQQTTEELIHELARATEAVKAAKRAKKAATQHLKDCQDTLTEIADALCERDQPTQDALPFDPWPDEGGEERD